MALEVMDKVEFFRAAALMLAFFLDRVLVPPTGRLAPEPRFRFLMTSVFKLSGLTTPWSFKNKPQALQRGCPSGLRRHNGVVCVKQLVQVVGVSVEFPAAPCKFVVEPCFAPGGGDEGRLAGTEERPDERPTSAGGEWEADCASLSNGFILADRPGVDAVLDIFPLRRSL